MKHCSVVTIFPEIIKAYAASGIMKRAVGRGLLGLKVHDLRDYTTDKHRSVDDYPYGGGAGMVMKPEPFFRIAQEHWSDSSKRRIILLSPKGRSFTQSVAEELYADERELVFFCGRYEAIDERVHAFVADDEISVGDYVLTGGELPALVIIDAVVRLIPGALGDSRSAEEDSFSCGLLDYPHYTRPEGLGGKRVPEVLLSGNHREIELWRRTQALKVTFARRPDLLKDYRPTPEEEEIIEKIKEDGV